MPKDRRDRRKYQKAYRKKNGRKLNARRRNKYKKDLIFKKKQMDSGRKYYRDNRVKVCKKKKSQWKALSKKDKKRRRHIMRKYDRKNKTRKALKAAADRRKFPEKYKARLKEMNFKRKILALQKYGGKCKACGIDELAVLSMDHVNDDGHKERKGDKHATHYFHILKQKRRKDLQVLCMNCQFRKRKYGPNIKEWDKKKQFMSKIHPVKIRKTRKYSD